ncbi:hypothetical protein CTA1_5612 [Colletotrichum tanaceti]|uniref:Protein kinase domain-containing protein n=1 Tax=Colletotrichum tanaceti TaxID=1306861 RepID=A0A4U6XFP3_9PEZI|nr:hypothetical protein CTA1_5612 [Colletotrichum tanaceti]
MSFSSSEDSGASYSAENETILLDHKELYSEGRHLRLRPHKPLPPYGSHLYPLPKGFTSADMMLSEEEKVHSLTRLAFDSRNAPLNLDGNNQHGEDAEMEVEILQTIGGDPGSGYSLSPGPQKALCRVVVAPLTSPYKQEQEIPVKGQLLFLKIFDPMFWHRVVDITKSRFKVPIQADSAFSDEFGAYHFLYGCGRTGPPDISPEFYGGWTIEVASVNPVFANQSRHVAILAIGYVDGVCLQDLFSPTGPISKTVELYTNSSVPASFNTGQDQRMKIVAKLMDGTVTQEFLGLDHCELHPRNVIVSMRNSGQPLEEPRAVLVGYGRALVDDLRSEPARFWKHFPTKHHPVIRFGWQRLDPFKGWIPLAWRGPEHDVDDAPLLDKWMVETFGPLTGNAEYTTFVPEALPTGSMPEEQQCQ